MRVLHLAKFYFPRKGGIETATKNIAEYRDSNYHHLVFTNGLGEVKNNKGNTIVYSNQFFSFGSQPISLGYLRGFIKNRSFKDIVHYHHPNYWAALIAILLPTRSLIVHWHADVEVKNRILKFILSRLEKKVAFRAKKIIIGTNTYAGHSHSLTGFEHKFEIIPYGIQQLTHEIDLSKKRNTFLTVGRLVSYKGIAELVDNIQIPSDWKWIIVGSGPEKAQIKRLISARQLDSKIILMGNVDDKKLSEIYAHSKIFLFPSLTRAESYGIVQVEAMKNGLAILNFKIEGSGVPELIISGENGYTCDHANYDIFNERLVELCSNSSLLDKFQNRSISHFKEKYLVLTYQSRIEGVYAEVCSEL
jgi:glycosyltransferase involved in cell wall biosynthesis